MDQFYDGFLYKRYDDFLFYAREATWKGKFMWLPRFQKNLKYKLDGVLWLQQKDSRPEHTGQNNKEERQAVPDQHHPLQLHPPTPKGSLWLDKWVKAAFTTPSTSTVSTDRGRCGPCCSVAPRGNTATVRCGSTLANCGQGKSAQRCEGWVTGVKCGN